MIATLQSVFDGFYCHDDRSRIPVKPKIIHPSRATLRFHVLLLLLIISWSAVLLYYHSEVQNVGKINILFRRNQRPYSYKANDVVQYLKGI